MRKLKNIRMKGKLLLMITIILLMVNCRSNSKYEIAEKPYIISYKLLNTKSLESLRKVMEPSGMEQAGFKFKKAFLLDVNLDTLFNSVKEFEHHIFIGFQINSRTYLQIFAIDLNYGSINPCRPLRERSSVIVNKSRTLFNNTNYLKGLLFSNDTITYCNDRTETTIGIWELASNYHLSGQWHIDHKISSNFENPIYHELWNVNEDQIKFISKENGETLDSSNYRIISDSLIIHKFEDTLNIKTYSDMALLIGDFKSDSSYILIKE